MGEYNQIEGKLTIPREGGRDLSFSRRVTPRIKGQYEDWLELRARRRVFKFRQELSPDEFRESNDAVARQSNNFRWGGPVCNETLTTLPGIVKFMALLAEAAGEKVSASELMAEMTPAQWVVKEHVWPNGGEEGKATKVWRAIPPGPDAAALEFATEEEARRHAENNPLKPLLLSAFEQIIAENKPNFLEPPPEVLEGMD